MTWKTSLLRHTVPKLIGFPPFKYLSPVSNLLKKTGYSFQYLAWFNRENIKALSIETPRPFGHDNRFYLYEYIAKRYDLQSAPMTYLEFGVATGTTIKWWATTNKNPVSSFVGFDTFTGLPEAWAMMPKGGFSTGGKLPDIDDGRVRFVAGMFQQTLLNEIKPVSAFHGRTVIHLDADLYSSTLFVLMALDHLLKPGDILIFDEFAYVSDEFRAFHDYKTATGRKYKPIAAVNCGDVIAFELTED